MEKDNLKSLITQVYEELLETIDSQDELHKESVVSYLQDIALTIEQMEDINISSLEHTRLAFENAYKIVAHKSIASYKETNEKFEKLSHFSTLSSFTEECHKLQLDMQDEVTRANETIQKLSGQIKQLEETTNLDPLTKIFNRRALNSYLQQICSKDKLNHELHLLLLDIDDFKLVNDTYGHIAGDKVLILIAKILRKILRDGDKVFRYGGEEFVVILNRINAKTCKIIANRIIKIIESNQLIYKGQSLQVTMSIGGTTYKEDDTPESLISRADKALYKSKNNGKNQINMEEE